MDKQTKQILEAILSINESLSHGNIKSLAMLMCRSERVNEDADHRTRQMIADLRKDIISHFHTMDVITARVEMLNVGSEKESQVRNAVNTTVLEQLSYSGMTDRYEDVQEAHPETFDWIFLSAEQPDLPWDDFVDWLRQDAGIYWINGKAGSGKSTLMKHIYDSRHTTEYLREWYHNTTSQCCIATFFFWNSGTDLQRSQQGLLRSLLFQVLSRNPNLIPLVLPALWMKQYEVTSTAEHRIRTEKVWSLRELHEAFERLIKQQQVQISLCFFVDGLDEFSGDTEQLCMLFKRLEKESKMAKFCLSSRPWVTFQEHLGVCAKLRLQDLTSRDIDIYVRDKFQSSRAFMKLTARDPQLLESLKNEITEKAQGVFLWVRVVVLLLLRGANNRDSIAQLWTRLRSFPGDLYPLYRTILAQIEPLYLEWASKTFQVMRRTMQLEFDPFQKTSTTTASKFAETHGVEPPHTPPRVSALPLTVGSLMTALCSDAELECFQEMSAEELDMRCDDTRIHLTARCAGLLEILSEKGSAKITQGSKIVYMHRTARDFLEQESQWSKIISYTELSRFSADLAMLRASVTMLMSNGFSKSSTHTGECSSSIIFLGMAGLQKSVEEGFNLDHLRIAEDVIIYAHHADDHDGSIVEQVRYLEAYNIWRTRWIPQQQHITPRFKDANWLVGSTIVGLSGYVKTMLGNKSKAVQTEVSEILLYELCSSEHFEPDVPFAKSKMVSVLLELSSNHVYSLPQALPRLKAGPRWPAALDCLGRIQRSGSRVSITTRLVESYAAVLEAFLVAGIDPTDISGKVPPDYLLCRKGFEDAFLRELSSLNGSLSASALFHLGKVCFDRSVSAYNMKRIASIVGRHKSGISREVMFVDEA